MRLLLNRETTKVSVLSNLQYVFYNILIEKFKCSACLNEPKPFSKETSLTQYGADDEEICL